MKLSARKLRTARKQCEWCQDDEIPLYRKTLCRRCYRLERKRVAAEAAFASNPQDRWKEHECQVAKRMVELAQWEGEQYGNIERQDIDGLRLEMELRFLSRRLVGKDLFFDAQISSTGISAASNVASFWNILPP